MCIKFNFTILFFLLIHVVPYNAYSHPTPGSLTTTGSLLFITGILLFNNFITLKNPWTNKYKTQMSFHKFILKRRFNFLQPI